MPTWNYAPVANDEGESVNSGSRKNGDGTDSFKKRRDLCMAFVVMIAIVYVLARAGGSPNCDSASSIETTSATASYYSVREERLSSTAAHIIECIEANEGESQEACHLSRSRRFSALEQKGATLWMTGLSGSGKSTIAKKLEEVLVLEYGKHVYRLDGDNIRTGLNRDLGFSAEDRAESVRRVGELSCLFSDSGTITVVSLVSPYKNDRDLVRSRHEDQGIPFYEVYMDVSLNVVEDRDPKGLYKKARAGEIKGFTGIDDPYEPPINAEIVLPNDVMSVDECVEVMLRILKRDGVLHGFEPLTDSTLPLPDGGVIVDLLITDPAEVRKKTIQSESLPKVLLSDIDLQWLQVIAEGWAAPLNGFMRESVLLQTIHFDSYLIDPSNGTGSINAYSHPTNFNEKMDRQPPIRTSMSVPITLPITKYTKNEIDAYLAGHNNDDDDDCPSVALVTKWGETIALLKNPEVYEHRKEEIVSRVFGVIDPGQPYIRHMYASGDWLLGGEIELLKKIVYNDGLDQYRLTAKELMDEFMKRDADTVFAFQTRNPTHAGHAYLMRSAREKLVEKGFKNPILWLSPLGGWTKADDVPLDVRVNQHQAVLNEGMLDPETTVMAIWPAPMIYAGPTEVIFHAKSRRNAGASYFVVGRDPAGMKGSELAVSHMNDDLYNGEHGRYVLQMSPGLDGMELASFENVYYDVRDNDMKPMDDNRPDDFISISGTKMRTLAKNGATPCPNRIPNDLVVSNCVPKGFMVPTGWSIVCDYYQNQESDQWVAWSKQFVDPFVAKNTRSIGDYGTRSFKLEFSNNGGKSGKLSPWHDISLQPGDASSNVFNFVVEIPMYSTAKMEAAKNEVGNPIMQDTKASVDTGKEETRFYSYGVPFFNYGFIPQTWEDPNDLEYDGRTPIGGDNDPIDVMEISDLGPLPMGSVVPVKVLGMLKLIDEGEVDYKIICIRTSDPLSKDVKTLSDLNAAYVRNLRSGKLKHMTSHVALTDRLVDWLVNYKTAEGKGQNVLGNEGKVSSVDEALIVIDRVHENWKRLVCDESIGDEDFYISPHACSD